AHLRQLLALLLKALVQAVLEFGQLLPPGEDLLGLPGRLLAARRELGPQPFQLLLSVAPLLFAGGEFGAGLGDLLLLPAQGHDRLLDGLRLAAALGLDLGAARLPDVALGLDLLAGLPSLYPTALTSDVRAGDLDDDLGRAERDP